MDSTTKKSSLRNLAKVGLFLFGVLVIAVLSSKAHKTGSIGPMAQAPDTNEVAVRFVAFLITDDIKAGSTGAETMISTVSGSEFLQWAGLGQRVTAKEYEAAYDANEIAADNEFKDRRLLVSGKLAGIEKDFTGEGYLDLAGSNVFLPGVHAQLTQGSIVAAASMKKGQKLDLVCNGAGRVVTIAMLADCQPLPDYLNAITPLVEAKVRDALDGKTPLSAKSAQILEIMYAFGTLLPTNSTCRQGDTKMCEAEFAAVAKDRARQQAVQEQMKMIAPRIKIAQ